MRPIVLFVLCVMATACASRSIVPDGAEVEKVADGFKFTEGPASDARGNLYFSDIPNQRIHRFEESTGETHVFRENSDGANGLLFDAAGRLYACEGAARRVTVSSGPTDRRTVVERIGGNRFNSPNDLSLDAHGGLYFTDPRYGPRDNMELPVEAVYYVDAGGDVSRIITDRQRPNGIILSGDGKRLYVADHAAKEVWVYGVAGPGRVENGQRFATMEDGGPDGMTVDARGNVYAAGAAHVWVWNRRGELIDKIAVPEGPANCAFAGKGRRTLYITARTSLYRIELNTRGVR